MMICPRCGEQFKDGTPYCTRCGSPLVYPQQIPQQMPYGASPQPKKKKTGCLIAIGAFLLLGMIGGAGRGRNKPAPQPAATTAPAVTTRKTESSKAEQTEAAKPQDDHQDGYSDRKFASIGDIRNRAKEVPNDATGRWRVTTISADNIKIPEYAKSYYENYFKSDDEIHAIVNYALKTTTRLSAGDGMLFVTVHQYIDGEENDAKQLFGGAVWADYMIDLSTGEITKNSSKEESSPTIAEEQQEETVNKRNEDFISAHDIEIVASAKMTLDRYISGYELSLAPQKWTMAKFDETDTVIAMTEITYNGANGRYIYVGTLNFDENNKVISAQPHYLYVIDTVLGDDGYCNDVFSILEQIS